MRMTIQANWMRLWRVGKMGNLRKIEFAELENFFSSDAVVGEEIDSQLARITDQALRGPKNPKDKEKMQNLKDKYKRPGNIKNLQVPKVEEMIWNQLRSTTKNVDFINQQAAASYNLALIPIIKTIELLRGRPGLKEVNNHLMDAFKILCLSIKSTNVARAERIRKDLQPKYKTICDIEASAT